MQTTLLEIHRNTSCDIGEYRGYPVPLSYGSIEAEYDAAVNDIAMIDRSWVGRIEVTGADRLDLLHRLSTNDLLKAKAGQVVGTVFTTDKGRIIDFVHILIRDSSLLLLISPGNEETFSAWIDKFTILEDLQLKTVTHSTAMFSLIGPKATAFASSLEEQPLQHNTLIENSSLPFPATILFRTEFKTDIIDIILASSDAARAWGYLLTVGTVSTPKPIGIRAYQVFRISRGIPELGAELSDQFNPYEAGLSHAISFTKGCYIGQEVIARLDTYKKVQKGLWGIISSGDDAMQPGAEILENGDVIGKITSSTPDSIRGKRIGLAIVKKSSLQADDHVSISYNGTTSAGSLSAFPVAV
ncbi:MAG: aminomethyltransferase family protein [Bacteroidetes bacterium]|nr:aminomethyltransferase family protein [Bacteroidota bacterium]MCW5896302.1 aminomethyltransferase family protein [Bacteroidota bacterium]